MATERRELACVRDELIACLAEEKAALCRALGSLLEDDGARTVSSSGASGRLRGLPGTFFVNCGRTGRPHQSVGKGASRLAHYRWIPVVYREEGLERSYVIALLREDLDVTTGNLHVDFTKLQISRLAFSGIEVGGQANPVPAPMRDADGRPTGAYQLEYQAQGAFPVATSATTPHVGSDRRPWGYPGFEGRIPVMDMADAAYDPVAVARFFFELAAHDIAEAHARG